MQWTPNKVTALRVAVGFAAVSLFGRGPWAKLAAVGLTVTTIALDALDGHIARRKNLATPVGAQIDILVARAQAAARQVEREAVEPQNPVDDLVHPALPLA